MPLCRLESGAQNFDPRHTGGVFVGSRPCTLCTVGRAVSLEGAGCLAFDGFGTELGVVEAVPIRYLLGGLGPVW